MIKIPVSLGELVDKITILGIKIERVKIDGVKFEKMYEEYNKLMKVLHKTEYQGWLHSELNETNRELWDLENVVRSDVDDDTFMKAAKSIFHKNEQRSQIKDAINKKHGSSIIEVKQHD